MKRRPWYKRLRWDNIAMLSLLLMGAYMVIIILIDAHDYDLEYVEYQFEEGERLFNVIQDENDFYPFGWDTHDFVALTLDKNKLSKPTDIKAGDVVLIPITYPKGENKSCN